MTYKKPWLTSIIVMSIFALFGVLGIMVLAQSQDAENSDEGRGESHEGGSEERDVRGNTDGEEAGRAYALDETYDEVRGGARLILAYDATNNTFSGTVENTTDEVLQSVRVEVHLSNGVELGPTTPIDLAPGEQADVMMDATNMVFDSWSTHVEVGLGEHGSRSEVCQVKEGSGEHEAESATRSVIAATRSMIAAARSMIAAARSMKAAARSMKATTRNVIAANLTALTIMKLWQAGAKRVVKAVAES